MINLKNVIVLPMLAIIGSGVMQIATDHIIHLQMVILSPLHIICPPILPEWCYMRHLHECILQSYFLHITECIQWLNYWYFTSVDILPPLWVSFTSSNFYVLQILYLLFTGFVLQLSDNKHALQL